MGVIEQFFHTFINQILSKMVWILILMIPFTVFVVWLISQKRTKFRKWTAKAILLSIVLGGYMGGIFALTLFSREIGGIEKSFELEPFWSYREAIVEGNISIGIEIISNILLFIPFGILMPVFFRAYERMKTIICASAILSLIIELIQGIAAIGLFEFDDIVNNALGATIGFLTWKKSRQWKSRYTINRTQRGLNDDR